MRCIRWPVRTSWALRALAGATRLGVDCSLTMAEPRPFQQIISRVFARVEEEAHEHGEEEAEREDAVQDPQRLHRRADHIRDDLPAFMSSRVGGREESRTPVEMRTQCILRSASFWPSKSIRPSNVLVTWATAASSRFWSASMVRPWARLVRDLARRARSFGVSRPRRRRKSIVVRFRPFRPFPRHSLPHPPRTRHPRDDAAPSAPARADPTRARLPLVKRARHLVSHLVRRVPPPFLT